MENRETHAISTSKRRKRRAPLNTYDAARTGRLEVRPMLTIIELSEERPADQPRRGDLFVARRPDRFPSSVRATSPPPCRPDGALALSAVGGYKEAAPTELTKRLGLILSANGAQFLSPAQRATAIELRKNTALSSKACFVSSVGAASL